MKHKKNAETILFLLSFTKCQCEKNIERTYFVSAGTKKGWETPSLGATLPQHLTNPKNKFPVKFLFT